ncbi:MAG: hypothetical protein HY537_08000 [Deltaproteobacteria bacterium]|nr:hypothetical protein [Deltaproteobacteria bacterium]
MGVGFCPRCATLNYERLRTHSYCVQCHYSPDLDDDVPAQLAIPLWVIKELDLKRQQNDLPFEPHFHPKAA